MQSIDSKILSRIYGRGRGCVVTPGDFLDLGSRQAVDLALHRLVKKGTLRRLAHGLYDYPRVDADLGPLSPTTDAVVKALKGRDNILLQPSGGYAANQLGLSDQVPIRSFSSRTDRRAECSLASRSSCSNTPPPASWQPAGV